MADAAQHSGTRGPVVVGVDGSPPAQVALDWAAAEAAGADTSLRVVRGFEWHAVGGVERTRGPRRGREEARTAAEAQLTEAADAVRDRHPGLQVEAALVDERPAHALVSEAAHASLLVVGSRGLGGFQEMLLGSVSHAVAAHAACPVVVVPAAAGAPPAGPVVVGVDGSAESLAAVDFALERAERLGAPVVAVRAWTGAWAQPAGDLTLDWVDWEAHEREQARHLEECLQRTDRGRRDVTVVPRVIRAHPVRALLDAAASPSMLVVGSRGHGGLAGMVLGSVSQAVLRRASVPVAVVKASTSA